MHDKVAVPIIAGIAGLAAVIAVAFTLTTYPRQGSDLFVPIIQEPTSDIVGIAPDKVGLISSADAVAIALHETRLTDSDIEHIYVDRFYMDETGKVYRVNPATLEMTSADDKSRAVEKLASFDKAEHYWVISLYMGIDSGYVAIIDASGGSVKDVSTYDV